jgi:hypothetical protein
MFKTHVIISQNHEGQHFMGINIVRGSFYCIFNYDIHNVDWAKLKLLNSYNQSK